MSIKTSFNVGDTYSQIGTESVGPSLHTYSPFRMLLAAPMICMCLTTPMPTQNNSTQTLHNNSGKNEMVQVTSTVGEVLDMKAHKNLARLDDIAKLEEDWNGYGAKSFPAALIEKCKHILGTLSCQPDIYPTGRQSIQIQYELEDRSYLGFEIFEEKTVYLKVPRREYDKAETGNLVGEDETEKIERIVSEFYGRASITE